MVERLGDILVDRFLQQAQDSPVVGMLEVIRRDALQPELLQVAVDR